MNSTVGLLGGIGPESTGDFYLKLIREFQITTHPKSNADYPHVIINSISAPDLIDGNISRNTLKYYINGIKELEKFGVDYIGIICNTAYCFLEILQKNTLTPIINLRAEVELELRNLKTQSVLVLGSPNTIRNGLYKYSF